MKETKSGFHKTWAGRVVYERRPTPFKWRDAARILGKLPNPDPFDDVEEYLNAILCEARALQKLALGGFWNVVADLAAMALGPWASMLKNLGDWLNVLRQLRLWLSRSIPSWSKSPIAVGAVAVRRGLTTTQLFGFVDPRETALLSELNRFGERLKAIVEFWDEEY